MLARIAAATGAISVDPYCTVGAVALVADEAVTGAASVEPYSTVGAMAEVDAVAIAVNAREPYLTVGAMTDVETDASEGARESDPNTTDGPTKEPKTTAGVGVRMTGVEIEILPTITEVAALAADGTT